MGTLRDLQFALQLKIEELRQRDTLIDELELELDTKDELIRRLQEELDRYRTTITLPGPSEVTTEGRLNVTKDGQKVSVLEPEDISGKLLLLYDCTYIYSVSAQTDGNLRVNNRSSYQTVLMQLWLRSCIHLVEILKSVSCLQMLPEDVVIKISDHKQEDHYTNGSHTTQQEPQETLFTSLLKARDAVRTVNLMAVGEMTCLTLTRKIFKDIIAELMSDIYQEI